MKTMETGVTMEGDFAIEDWKFGENLDEPVITIRSVWNSGKKSGMSSYQTITHKTFYHLQDKIKHHKSTKSMLKFHREVLEGKHG